MFSWRRGGSGEPDQVGLGAGRRTLVLLALVAVVGVPAGVLRAFCAGHSCDEPADASSEVPFCSLPDELRSRVAAGFREGRSPDLLAVAADSISQDGDRPVIPWPSIAVTDSQVPLAFWGTGVNPDAEIPPQTGLDDVAPTIESILGFDRAHPEVRSGSAVEGLASGERPRLVVEFVWIGRGSADLDRPPPALSAAFESGASTLAADTVSVPVDPAAVLTTIGTGGRPSQHGITGTVLRDESGRLRKAWTDRSPLSVIATLGDDLDEQLRQKPLIGMVGSRRSYTGAIGGNWHVDVDRDLFLKTERGDEARGGVALIDAGFGEDAAPDLAVVAIESGIVGLDAAVGKVSRRAREVAGDSVAFVFTATGATGSTAGTLASEIPDAIPGDDVGSLIEEVVPGGFFLDQNALADRKVSEDEVLRSLTRAEANGESLFADVFPAIAVAFGRYC